MDNEKSEVEKKQSKAQIEIEALKEDYSALIRGEYIVDDREFGNRLINRKRVYRVEACEVIGDYSRKVIMHALCFEPQDALLLKAALQKVYPNLIVSVSAKEKVVSDDSNFVSF